MRVAAGGRVSVAADHVEVDVSDGLVEREERVVDVVFRAEQAFFLGRPERKDHCSLGFGGILGERARDLENAGSPGRVVVGAGPDVAATGSFVIVVGADHDYLTRKGRIGSGDHPQHVAGAEDTGVDGNVDGHLAVDEREAGGLHGAVDLLLEGGGRLVGAFEDVLGDALGDLDGGDAAESAVEGRSGLFVGEDHFAARRQVVDVLGGRIVLWRFVFSEFARERGVGVRRVDDDDGDGAGLGCGHRLIY